jgi:hypothetical protein
MSTPAGVPRFEPEAESLLSSSRYRPTGLPHSWNLLRRNDKRLVNVFVLRPRRSQVGAVVHVRPKPKNCALLTQSITVSDESLPGIDGADSYAWITNSPCRRVGFFGIPSPGAQLRRTGQIVKNDSRDQALRITAILESWLLNHLLRETHSFHQLGETKIGAQGIEQEVGLEAR